MLKTLIKTMMHKRKNLFSILVLQPRYSNKEEITSSKEWKRLRSCHGIKSFALLCILEIHHSTALVLTSTYAYLTSASWDTPKDLESAFLNHKFLYLLYIPKTEYFSLHIKDTEYGSIRSSVLGWI